MINQYPQISTLNWCSFLFVLSIDTLLYLYCQLMINSMPYALHNTHWVSFDQLTSANLFCVCIFTVSYLDLYRVLILYFTKPIEADMINQLPLGKLPPPAPAATDRAVSQNFWLSFPLMSGHQSIFHCCRVISEHFPLISGPFPASSTIYSPTLSPALLPACIGPHCNALDTLLQPLVT